MTHQLQGALAQVLQQLQAAALSAGLASNGGEVGVKHHNTRRRVRALYSLCFLVFSSAWFKLYEVVAVVLVKHACIELLHFALLFTSY